MSERWRVTVAGPGVRLRGVVDGRPELTELARITEPVGWVVVASPLTELADVMAMDREEWPQGHPCRDCGQLYGHHPNTRCVAWR